ncbi:MAG: hypothetical protein JO323_18920 [Acidobacteriia bacterium]|nr:hypothetical protein [Terriglobia bacterium]
MPVLLGMPPNATNSAPQGALGLGSNYYTANHNDRNTALIFPKQLFVRFHPFSKSQNFQVGRFTFLDGSDTVLAILADYAECAIMQSQRVQLTL